jgi:dienelactone hydrolase
MKKTSEAMQPITALWDLYDPAKAPHRFRARSAQSAKSWQRKTRSTLARALGFTNLPPAPFRPRRLERVDKGDYVREKILIQTARNIAMPVYMLIPKGASKPTPTVIAWHGHGYGVKDIVGLWENGDERDTPEGYHADFGVALCRRGFAVAAPEISCFGERHNDYSDLSTFPGQPVPDTCHHTATLAFHLGGSALGLRVHDGRRLIDYLKTRRDLDTRRLGAMGISGGGMHTLFSTALDTRIKACVVSGYYSTFRDSILAMNHCTCNFVPGIHAFGEMHDIAGLVAPRPMLVEAASRDPIFPIASVRKGVARARKVYDVFGARKNVVTDYFEGRHQISGAKAYDFLWDALVES